jgi:hypothetical protein
MSCEQSVGQYHNIKLVNKYFKNVAKFKSMVTTVINQSFMQEEIEAD